MDMQQAAKAFKAEQDQQKKTDRLRKKALKLTESLTKRKRQKNSVVVV
jgi:hypothetical protein